MPMSPRERYVWYALAILVLAFAFWFGVNHPELYRNKAWTPPVGGPLSK